MTSTNMRLSTETDSMASSDAPCIYFGRILLGEVNPLLAAMKRVSSRWSSSQQDDESDPLIKQLRDLQIKILHLRPDSVMEPSTFLDPFLSIIKSEDVIGPITKNALAAVNRMLSYGLLNPDCCHAANAVESIASAVTHARFVGTDAGADEVVLCEILTVLRSLMLGPVGHLLTNESVCEILNSCFRICFETRLSELLRNCTEDAMRHMIQLLFSRLPQFKDDPNSSIQSKKLKMRTGTSSEVKGKKLRSRLVSTNSHSTPEPPNVLSDSTAEPQQCVVNPDIESTVKIEDKLKSGSSESLPAVVDDENLSNISGQAVDTGNELEELDVSHTHLAPEPVESDNSQICSDKTEISDKVSVKSLDSENLLSDSNMHEETSVNSEFVNPQGVKFTPSKDGEDSSDLLPYGLPCVKEVLRFLISLISPIGGQNSPNMIHTSLNLLVAALEVGCESIGHNKALLSLVQDQLCHNLFLNLKADSRPPIFMASLRTCTLLFESLRIHLKFQLEMMLNKLIAIISSDSTNVSYFYKEHSLETILQLWRMPGLIIEIFINFDCNIYSANIFEELTQILSKNAFPVQGFYSTNLLSLEALLTVIDTIERRSLSRTVRRDSKLPKNAHCIPSTSGCPPSGYLFGIGLLGGFAPVTPRLQATACLRDDRVVNRKELLGVKEKKNVIATATDMFNTKPEKGISFLKDEGIIDGSNESIAMFLRENSHLDKKVMGEFISKKKNVKILGAFVKSFNFKGRRIDECLRTFLESFRLPGEAPLISIIIEHFSSHWHLSNDCPFGKDDAAFTLAYAIIMLNVDQHNQNAKKQNIPMTLDQFCKNLRGVNDGSDFDKKMLEEIYNAIHKEEIVMPAEQSGIVKENYLWKILLKRGATSEGHYLLINDSVEFDKDLFTICWGPTVASISYVFDKSSEESLVHNALNGFRKCALISARFGMSDVFDNLVISLCKFTTLTVSYRELPESVAISFGKNKKAQLAARTLFKLVTSHADILRDGWRNVFEILLQLFRCNLLPDILVESEDFVDPSGKIRLVKANMESIPRVESGLFSSLYSYIAMGESSKTSSPEDMEYIERANNCITICRPEKIINESAFLRYDSLNELLKAMIGAGDANSMVELADYSASKSRSTSPKDAAMESGLDEYSQSFLLELVISVLVANKDRAGGVWPSVRDHIYSLLMSAAAVERHFLLERCVVAILKAAKVLIRRPELANPILQSLRMLLLLRSHVLDRVAIQIVSGINEVLSVNADHIQDSNDWAIILALLECAGAGAKPPPIVSPNDTQIASDTVSSGVDSDPETGETSQISSDEGTSVRKSPPTSIETAQNAGGWILVGREGEIEPVAVRALSINQWDIVHQRQFTEHKPEALTKAVDTLCRLVRERHITAFNLACIVQTCRTFVEATLHGGFNERKLGDRDVVGPSKKGKFTSPSKEGERRPKSPQGHNTPDDIDHVEMSQTYQQLSEKLLDLMDTLHTSASHILDLKSQEEKPLQCFHLTSSVSLWQQALCPLLQGIARYCCDVRPLIRSLSMTYLQRALLNHDLQTLSANEWESCFNKVLFPLLAKLLQPIDYNGTVVSLEETRVRAATLVQKVFLRHLTPLLSLPTFTALWLTILDFMDKYLNTHRSDHLGDAIPEILKNMLLVMETTQVFHTQEGFTQLWSITWERIDIFLPDFRHQLFKTHPPSDIRSGRSKDEKVSVEEVEDNTAVSDSEIQRVAASPKSSGLSLAEDENEAVGSVILQPPLPHIYPIAPSPPIPTFLQLSETSTSSNQNILSDFGSTSPVNLPSFLPINFDGTQTVNLLCNPVIDVKPVLPSDQLNDSIRSHLNPEQHDKVTTEIYRPTSLLFNNASSIEFPFQVASSPIESETTDCLETSKETGQ